MKASLHLKASQHLAMTPQLQQSIRLLQLSSVELQQEVAQALAENPMLEREDGDETEENEALADPGANIVQPVHDLGDDLRTESEPSDTAEAFEQSNPIDIDEGPYDYTSGSGGGHDDFEHEQADASTITLREHLLEQMRLTSHQLRDRALMELVIDALDDEYPGTERVGTLLYEDFIAGGNPDYVWSLPADEWDAIALNYTSGTTGRPKGVVYHHRGTFLEAMGNISAWPLPLHLVYLWTLPLFHCNGWCFAWSTVAMGGTQVCLRAVDPDLIFRLIGEHGVTHMCGAPTVLSMLTASPAAQTRSHSHTVHIQTGGSPPPAKVIKAMEEIGFQVLQIYGMTELQGPSTYAAVQAGWAGLPLEERANFMARQGVRYPVVEEQRVGHPDTCEPMPQDGETIGEILIRSNTVMLGYLDDEAATAEAFKGGWMHTGDLAVWHADHYIEIKDRKKDIIISGGENISSVEVEIALYRHPATQLAAVVAKPDEKWGETPCAFVQLKPDMQATEAEIIQWCRDHLAHYKVPRQVVFGPLPTTATGKIQKFALRERARSAT